MLAQLVRQKFMIFVFAEKMWSFLGHGSTIWMPNCQMLGESICEGGGPMLPTGEHIWRWLRIWFQLTNCYFNIPWTNVGNWLFCILYNFLTFTYIHYLIHFCFKYAYFNSRSDRGLTETLGTLGLFSVRKQSLTGCQSSLASTATSQSFSMHFWSSAGPKKALLPSQTAPPWRFC